MTMAPRRRRVSVLVIFLAAALAASILFAITDRRSPSTPSPLRREDADAREGRRQLVALAQYVDPKSVTLRSDAPLEKRTAETTTAAVERPREQFSPVNHDSRSRCQIVYILGVEGSTHHGFVPVVEALARNQVDPSTGLAYDVDVSPRALKAGLFGWFRAGKIQRWGFESTPDVDDPAFVQTVVRESCPDDGKRHVLVEWASFPSGHEDDARSYRVHRKHEWLSMTPDEIAGSDEALQHPTNMNAFYQAYSPYANIRFVVLHRPFLETIASHADWDGGPEIRSNVIRGFMLMLRRFLDTHVFDRVSGTRLWSLVCVDRVEARNYASEHDVKVARKRVLSYLTEFLRWPDGDCPQCFDEWKESTKNATAVLGEENVAIMEEHKTFLEGVWPPPGEEGIPEQQCRI